VRRLAVLVVVALAAVLISPASVPALGATANNDAAHACQQGGYLSYTRADGTGFRNAGECTSYAARDGQIVGIGAVCTHPANGGCIVLDDVTIREGSITPPTFTYSSPGSSYTLSGTMIFTPTCQILSAGCDYSTVTITGTGTFSTSTNASGTWSASYSSPDPYSFTDASLTSTSCADAAIRMVTARLALSSTAGSGGAFVEVRLDSSASGALKNFVFGNFYASGLPSGGFHTDALSGLTLTC
jgi:hypothetical protein